LPLALLELGLLAQSRRRASDDDGQWIVIAIWIAIVGIGVIRSWFKQAKEARERATDSERRALQRETPRAAVTVRPVSAAADEADDPDEDDDEDEAADDPVGSPDRGYWQHAGAAELAEVVSPILAPHSFSRLGVTIPPPPAPGAADTSDAAARGSLLPKELTGRFTEAQLLLIGREIFERPVGMRERGKGRART
jgi:hypothetical protein